jgi:hypothetical protein
MRRLIRNALPPQTIKGNSSEQLELTGIIRSALFSARLMGIPGAAKAIGWCGTPGRRDTGEEPEPSAYRVMQT